MKKATILSILIASSIIILIILSQAPVTKLFTQPPHNDLPAGTISNSTTNNLSNPTAHTYTTLAYERDSDDDEHNVILRTNANTNVNTSIPVTLKFNQAPIIVFSIQEPQIIANKVVTFNATSTFDPNNVPLTFTWDFGDGTPTAQNSSPVQTHVFSSPGKYNVILKVCNGKLESTQTMQIIVTNPNQVATSGYDIYLIWGGVLIGLIGVFGVTYATLGKRKPPQTATVFHPLKSIGSAAYPSFILNPDRCVGCGLCARKCPNTAITIVNRKPVHNASKCCSCMQCMNRCVRRSITLVPIGSQVTEECAGSPITSS